MGMTDRQFDSYQKRLLRLLCSAKEEILKGTPTSNTTKLDEIINDIESELKRP